MKQTIVALFIAGFVLSACGAPATPTLQADQHAIETLVAGTMQALTQSAPPAETAVPTQPVENTPVPVTGQFTYGSASMVIPPALGIGAAGQDTDRIEYPPCMNPSCADPSNTMPVHSLITLIGYPVAGEPRVMVFKASEYAGIGPSMQSDVAALQGLRNQPAVVPEGLVNTTFGTRPEVIAFQNGYGVGYLSQPMNGIMPVTNDSLYYYFQGVTDDDQYYIAAVLPMNTPFLAADANPDTVVPAGGIPFDMNGSVDQFNQYYDSMHQLLDSASPEVFTPTLNDLKTFLGSLRVGQ